jgi:hypothetical protein
MKKFQLQIFIVILGGLMLAAAIYVTKMKQPTAWEVWRQDWEQERFFEK